MLEGTPLMRLRGVVHQVARPPLQMWPFRSSRRPWSGAWNRCRLQHWQSRRSQVGLWAGTQEGVYSQSIARRSDRASDLGSR